ncbi:hypothetical protein TYRP_002017 [Tyrophagus putrescentiae]|nr:hypothetical protein TYRP_002017 [Tyrophagus putrescentiae]
MSQEIVKQRRTTGVRRNDFIDLLVNASVSEEELKSDDYNKFTANDDKDDEVVETPQANTGHSKLVKKLDDDEIAASTLTYLLYELAKNPTVQERLYEELCNVKLESDDFYDTVMNKLPYLNAVVSETLRKYPPVNRLERRAGVSGYKLGGVTLQKNQMVYVSQYAMQHDPELFPDPESFQPERFLPENKHLIVPYSYNPFGTGSTQF